MLGTPSDPSLTVCGVGDAEFSVIADPTKSRLPLDAYVPPAVWTVGGHPTQASTMWPQMEACEEEP